MSDLAEKRGNLTEGRSLVALALLCAVLAGVGVATLTLVVGVPGRASGALEIWSFALLLGASIVLGFSGLAFFLVGIIRWALLEFRIPQLETVRQQADQTAELLRTLNERILISETAKRLAYREQDRQILRKAIQDDLAKGDFDAALVLATEMANTYGYRAEAEDLRQQVLNARAASVDRQITEAVKGFDELLAKYEWDRALEEARRIQRLFPDSPRVTDLPQRVRDARNQHKLELERAFLQAAERDDIERAMDLLKEMDRYLTEEEAGPFRETARGVIGKKRQNLGVIFKLAVQDKDWLQAVTIGEQIIREFPNTKMADEVRSRLDLLRERAAGQQAVRTTQPA